MYSQRVSLKSILQEMSEDISKEQGTNYVPQVMLTSEAVKKKPKPLKKVKCYEVKRKKNKKETSIKKYIRAKISKRKLKRK